MRKVHISNLKYVNSGFCMVERLDGSYSDIYYYGGVDNKRNIEAYSILPSGTTRRGTCIPRSSKMLKIPLSGRKLYMISADFKQKGTHVFNRSVFDAIYNIFDAVICTTGAVEMPVKVRKILSKVDTLNVSDTAKKSGKLLLIFKLFNSKNTEECLELVVNLGKSYQSRAKDSNQHSGCMHCRIDGTEYAIKQEVVTGISVFIEEVKNVLKYVDMFEYPCKMLISGNGYYLSYDVRQFLVIRGGKGYVFSGLYPKGFLDYVEEYGNYYNLVDTDDESGMPVVSKSTLTKFKSIPYMKEFMKDYPKCVYNRCYKLDSISNAAMMFTVDSSGSDVLMMFRIKIVRGMNNLPLYYKLCSYKAFTVENKWLPQDVICADGRKSVIVDILDSFCDGRMLSLPNFHIGEIIHVGNKDILIKSIEDGTDVFKIVYELDGLAIPYSSILGKVDSSLDINYDKPIGFGDAEINEVRKVMLRDFETLRITHNGKYRIFKFVGGNVVTNTDHEVFSCRLFSGLVDMLPRLCDKEYFIARDEDGEIVEKFLYNRKYWVRGFKSGIKRIQGNS